PHRSEWIYLRCSRESASQCDIRNPSFRSALNPAHARWVSGAREVGAGARTPERSPQLFLLNLAHGVTGQRVDDPHLPRPLVNRERLRDKVYQLVFVDLRTTRG